jgi:hypothetical protein
MRDGEDDHRGDYLTSGFDHQAAVEYASHKPCHAQGAARSVLTPIQDAINVAKQVCIHYRPGSKELKIKVLFEIGHFSRDCRSSDFDSRRRNRYSR